MIKIAQSYVKGNYICRGILYITIYRGLWQYDKSVKSRYSYHRERHKIKRVKYAGFRYMENDDYRVVKKFIENWSTEKNVYLINEPYLAK